MGPGRTFLLHYATLTSPSSPSSPSHIPCAICPSSAVQSSKFAEPPGHCSQHASLRSESLLSWGLLQGGKFGRWRSSIEMDAMRVWSRHRSLPLILQCVRSDFCVRICLCVHVCLRAPLGNSSIGQFLVLLYVCLCMFMLFMFVPSFHDQFMAYLLSTRNYLKVEVEKRVPRGNVWTRDNKGLPNTLSRSLKTQVEKKMKEGSVWNSNGMQLESIGISWNQLDVDPKVALQRSSKDSTPWWSLGWWILMAGFSSASEWTPRDEPGWSIHCQFIVFILYSY